WERGPTQMMRPSSHSIRLSGISRQGVMQAPPVIARVIGRRPRQSGRELLVRDGDISPSKCLYIHLAESRSDYQVACSLPVQRSACPVVAQIDTSVVNST